MPQPSSERPTPMSMPRHRVRSIPPASTTAAPTPSAPRKHSFSEEYPPRGWSSAICYVDTGIFFAAARDSVYSGHLKSHYKGRLRTTFQVVNEVQHRARGRRGTSSKDQLLARCAAEAQHQFLSPSTVVIEQAIQNGEDARRFDEILRALVRDDNLRHRGTGSPSTPGRHAGEASLILRCTRTQAPGDTAVLLSNDGGASNVAADYGIPSRHFGHILQELVCDTACQVTAEEALDTFRSAAEVTTPPKDACPIAPEQLRCHAADAKCGECDRIESYAG